MKNNILPRVNRGALLAFFTPFLAMVIIYLFTGIYPGSTRSILASDAFSQFSNFHASFRNMLLGDQGLFYSWHTSLGLNFFALAAYYLGGLLTPLVIFFPNQMMPDALYFLTIIKIGLAGLTFFYYARRFKLSTAVTVSFSTTYALMSFITAHSELIMWLDAFIYLPLVIMGIEKIQDEGRPLLLFVSYFLLFTSNFYFGFMAGLFSFLYFVARTILHWAWAKRKIAQYLLTSLTAGGAAMLIILPTYLDLRTNGEAFSTITKLKTEATAPLDLLVKNMIGVYDTTKYGSIPFIYIGLIPLVFCLFYFFSRKIPARNKIIFAGLFAVIGASFYIVPMNLFWHGMHAPNMFLFRYSFVFSFLVIALALRSFRLVEWRDYFLIAGIFLSLALIFLLIKIFFSKSYPYLSIWSVVLSLSFLLLYCLVFTSGKLRLLDQKSWTRALAALMIAEAMLNSGGMIKGILDDWNYASRSLYTEPYPDIKQLVTDADENEGQNQFFRLENLNGVSSNDSFNYGYSGVSMFSSIRNRNSSSLLNELGFRSRGTNLNIRYANNTLLMDNLLGVRYNISQNQLSKFGFTQTSVANTYKLFENQYAAGLGILTDQTIYDVDFPELDNLTSQTNLFNALAGTQETFYQLIEPVETSTENTKVTKTNSSVTYAEETSNVGKDIHFQVTVPAGKQAYLSLYPMNFAELESSTAAILINGETHKSQINISGQYYDLGNYSEETTIDFVLNLYGTPSVTFMKPKIVLLDTAAYVRSAENIQANSVDFTMENNGAVATIETAEDQTLFTTIPYDLGWQAYLDGKKIPIKDFKNAFLTLEIPAGSHKLELKFVPAGFKLGVVIATSSLVIFAGYVVLLKKKTK
ncbi:YfhO family protein [Enterococcus timonensis]|uniref:YfhO family protein n=1 Tax=Enterococcus timonensis TaxID=1852364 RepID=UPI0008DA9DFE|nr:YfhO family protein [Enterococcus timonensis]